MTYKLQPPFEIYHNGVEISDRDGHLCTADNADIAKAIGVYHGLGTMGIDWMSGAEMSEAIPPAFSEYIGRAALALSKPHLAQAAE